MAIQSPLLPSVWDRLVDAASEEPDRHPWYGLADFMDAVGRDLTELLNTRQTDQGLSEPFPEARRSVLSYGLPDFTTFDLATPEQFREAAVAIEEVIARFEPRLKDLRVVMLDAKPNNRRTVSFRIEGRLVVDSAPDVVFDTTLELISGRYSVKTADHE